MGKEGCISVRRDRPALSHVVYNAIAFGSSRASRAFKRALILFFSLLIVALSLENDPRHDVFEYFSSINRAEYNYRQTVVVIFAFPPIRATTVHVLYRHPLDYDRTVPVKSTMRRIGNCTTVPSS